jgi:hypothetical protein
LSVSTVFKKESELMIRHLLIEQGIAGLRPQ